MAVVFYNIFLEFFIMLSFTPLSFWYSPILRMISCSNVSATTACRCTHEKSLSRTDGGGEVNLTMKSGYQKRKEKQQKAEREKKGQTTSNSVFPKER